MEINLGHAHKIRFWYLLGVFSKFPDKHPPHIYRGVPPGGFVGRLALPLVSKSLLEIRERVLKPDILLRLRMTFLKFLLFFSSLDLASCLKLTVAFFGNEESREGAQAFMGLFEGPRTLNCIVILVAVWLVYNSSDVCFLVTLCQLPRRRFAILVYSYWRLGCLKSVKGP